MRLYQNVFWVFIQFLQQEPGANGTEIMNSLKYVRPGGGFEPDFELTEKIDVNGDGQHPIYEYLKVDTDFVNKPT